MLFKPPVLKTKLLLPGIPAGAVYSDRIGALDIAGPRAAIITAPAGYGKTTSVLLSLQDVRENIHWYRLEKEDSELPVFFAHLIESLFGDAEEKTDSHLSLDSIGDIIGEYSILSALICQDAWSFYAGGDKPRYLVFDDFQNIGDNAEIREIVRYLISNMPPAFHIIVISRAETGILTEKLALSDEIASIDEEGLRFSKEEIKSLLLGPGKSGKGAKYADEVFDYTKGWIAGVVMMKHMPERKGSTDREDFHDDRQRIFRYLAGEVFAKANRDMVLRAARISLLEEFNSEDLAGIFCFDNPGETIAWLETNNFYINKINTDPVYYRFHSLMRDALRLVLESEYSQDEIKGLHLTAAAFYEKEGRFGPAIDHYLFGSDELNAVRAAAEKGQSLMDNGDIRSAAELVRRLPEDLVFGNATLLMIHGCFLSGTETEKSFSYLLKAIEMAVKNRDMNLAIKTQGFAISICVQQNNFQNIKGVVDLVPMSRAIRVSKQARKMLVHSLFLKFSTSFKVRPAKALGRIVDKVKMDDNEGLWQFSSLMSKAFLYGVIGDFREAEHTIQSLTNHPVALQNDRWRTFGLYLSGYLLVHMGDADALLQLADKMTSLGLKYAGGLASCFGANYTAAAKYQSRDFAGAVAAIEKAEKLFIEYHSLSMAAFARISRISWQAEQDPGGSYAGLIDEQVGVLAASGGNESFVTIAKTLAGAQHIHEGSPAKAEELLSGSWKWSKSKQAHQSQCGIAMHLSALYHAKGDLRREEKYLKFFGRTASAKGYTCFREMRYDSLVRTCARCVEKNIFPQYMADLVGRYFGFEAAAELLKDPSRIAADPEAFILRYPKGPRSGIKSVWIKLFGPFGLTVEGEEVDQGIFKTRKISGIFRYILANPGQTFSREKLSAAFWPDSGGKEAYNSLQVALFELRNILAGLDMAFDSENALIAENENGFYACCPEALESDAARFTSLYERLQGNGLSSDDEKAALCELTNLYDGDYLEESIAEDSTIARLHYKKIFAESAYRLAGIYRSEGRKELAKTLMLKLQKMENAGLTREEIKVALLLIEGKTRSEILRSLRISAAEAEQFESAIRTKILDMGGSEQVIAGIAAEYELTKREIDMLRCIRRGIGNREIAAELFLSEGTVKFHVRNLMNKLPVDRRQDVSAWMEVFGEGFD